MVELNDESRVTYNTNSQIKFKTPMLRSSLFDYSDAYILVKGTITAPNAAAVDADAKNANKKVQFKTCLPFTNCINEINNRHVDNAKDINILMSMSNFIEYSNKYWKTSESLWQCCKNILALNNHDDIVEFKGANTTDSLKFLSKNKWSGWR